MSEITAFPLSWPAGWRRTSPGLRERAQFGTSQRVKSAYGDHYYRQKRDLTIEEAIRRVLRELERMDIPRHAVIISTDLRLRQDGLPYSSQATGKLDPGAAVYWTVNKQRRCMAVDRYDRIADNLGAIAATLDAMRAIERHGGAEILDRAFTGFAALAAPAQQEAPHQVLGVAENATLHEIEYAYRRLAQQAHPDKAGGSTEQMARINAARDAMLESMGHGR